MAEHVIALAGNPNVGKSTVFNRLTGLRQHTGNWPGKTVGSARGRCRSGENEYLLVDTPGAYSLRARSAEEQVTADFLRSGEPEAILLVCDGGCLERNLIFALQVLELGKPVLLCVNLLDEARRRGVRLDLPLLSRRLGVPVLGISAREKGSRAALLNALDALPAAPPQRPFHLPEGEGRDEAARDAALVQAAERLCEGVVSGGGPGALDRRLDRLLTGRLSAWPLLLGLLLGILYLSIRGANAPSELLAALFEALRSPMEAGLAVLGTPGWLRSLLLDGVWRSLSWVVAVMLPPMAVFFPLFTLLEDAGVLPRLAYDLDRPFRACSSCGKQALCMCMGFGCNAAGVTGCRIIDSPRERMLAILTNSFVPCNGRFPLLLALIAMFLPVGGPLAQAAALAAVLLLAVLLSLLATALLGRTLLRGLPSSCLLELPPYRPPRLGQVLVRSVLDRTLFVLGRAAAVAAPAGALLWVLAHVRIGEGSLLSLCAAALDAPGRALGLDGAILLAFVLGLPANETVLPILLMIYSAGSSLAEPGALPGVHAILLSQGWTGETAVCMLVFTLLHWPCSTTLLSIKKETGSWGWTALAALLPTAFGLMLCALIHALFSLF